MVAYTDIFVDLLLSKHNINGTAVQRFLLVLRSAFYKTYKHYFAHHTPTHGRVKPRWVTASWSAAVIYI